MRARRGANAVEFALTLPFFLGLTFALIDFGWYFMHQAILDLAANRGCRAGAMVDPLIGDSHREAEDVIERTLMVLPTACGGACDILIADVGEVPGRSLSCEIEAYYQPFVGFWSMPDRQGSKTIMRYEWQR